MTTTEPNFETAPAVPAVGSPLDRPVRPLIGCDDLREWLSAQGFRCAEAGFGNSDNECNWYAYKRSTIPARDCECNDGKPMQLVVTPFKYRPTSAAHPDWQSAEVAVTGEAGGVWFKVAAYSMRHDDLRAKLSDVEASLLAAWNALRPNAEITGLSG